MRLGHGESLAEIETLSTGSLGLDIALGVGGLPRGRIIEIFGPESSGKTTLTLHLIAEAQKTAGTCAFIDAEHALDPSLRAQARGLHRRPPDLAARHRGAGARDRRHPGTLRRGRRDHRRQRAALVPRAELEGEMGDQLPGLQARLMSQALRKLTSSIARSKCMLVFTNQIRSKIGVMFGSPETTTGGNALKFYASVRLDIRRIGQVKDKDEVVGNQTAGQGGEEQGGAAVPRRRVRTSCTARASARPASSSISASARVWSRSPGSWFSKGSQRIGQGRENAKTYLRDHPDMAARSRAGDPRPCRGRRRPGRRLDLLDSDPAVED